MHEKSDVIEKFGPADTLGSTRHDSALFDLVKILTH